MITRRNWLGAGALLTGLMLVGGCKAQGRIGGLPDLAPLKSLAPYPLGVAATASEIARPDWASLAAAQYSRLTPEWEMKMEYVLLPDGSLRFDRADALTGFAQAHGMHPLPHESGVNYMVETRTFGRWGCRVELKDGVVTAPAVYSFSD